MRRWLGWIGLLIAGCTCGASDPPPPRAPAHAPEVLTEPAAPAPRERAEPERPPADVVRAFVARRREARRLAHAGQHAEAYAIFAELVRERPADRHLRCEAGYVAFQAERLDDAEREITTALRAWPESPARRDYVPVAMCLFNRGLVAEARGDHEEAARAWRRSIELRPNAGVARRLEALGVAEDERVADENETLEDVIAAACRELEVPRDDVEVERYASPTEGRSVAIVRSPIPYDEEEGGPEVTHIDAYLEDASGVHVLEPALIDERYYSWYDGHVEMGEPRFLAGPPELGELVAIGTGSWGRGDSPEHGDESYSDDAVYLCAERRDWACVRLELRSSAEPDCSLGCAGDEVEEVEGEEDEDDADREPLPERYVRGYALRWRVEGGELVLERDPDAEFTQPTDPPRQGRVALVALFAEE